MEALETEKLDVTVLPNGGAAPMVATEAFSPDGGVVRRSASVGCDEFTEGGYSGEVIASIEDYLNEFIDRNRWG